MLFPPAPKDQNNREALNRASPARTSLGRGGVPIGRPALPGEGEEKKALAGGSSRPPPNREGSKQYRGRLGAGGTRPASRIKHDLILAYCFNKIKTVSIILIDYNYLREKI